MHKKNVIVLFAAVFLSSLTARGYASGYVGNGGADPLEIYLVRGRILANKILKSLKIEHLSNLLSQEQKKWILENTAAAQQDMMLSEWDWKRLENQTTCTQTEFKRNAKIYFDRNYCEAKVVDVVFAAEILLYTSLQHFTSDKTKAEFFAHQLIMDGLSRTDLSEMVVIPPFKEEKGGVSFEPSVAWTFQSKSTQKKSRVLTWYRRPGSAENGVNVFETGFRELDPDNLGAGWKAVKSPKPVDQNIFSQTIPYQSTVVWSGDDLGDKASHQLFIWGGCKDSDCSEPYGKGILFNTLTNAVEQISQDNALSPRKFHVSAQANRRILVWGGTSLTHSDEWKINNDGRLFNLETKKWENLPKGDWLPAGRMNATLTTAGDKLILWGGCNQFQYSLQPVCELPLCDGAIFDIKTSVWKPIAKPPFAVGCLKHQSIWTGQKLIVLGGDSDRLDSDYGPAGSYDPVSNSWEEIPRPEFINLRRNPKILWTGREVVMAGGLGLGSEPVYTLTFYNPVTKKWRREDHVDFPKFQNFSFVWTGLELVFLGVTENGERSSAAYNPYFNR